MKPLLEGGMPIKGVAIFAAADGKPIDQPVQFVIGKETRINLGDAGAYAVTPVLSPDGSVKYPFRLLNPDGTPQTQGNVTVLSRPWGDFTISLGGKTAIALGFVSDEVGP